MNLELVTNIRKFVIFRINLTKGIREEYLFKNIEIAFPSARLDEIAQAVSEAIQDDKIVRLEYVIGNEPQVYSVLLPQNARLL